MSNVNIVISCCNESVASGKEENIAITPSYNNCKSLPVVESIVFYDDTGWNNEGNGDDASSFVSSISNDGSSRSSGSNRTYNHSGDNKTTDSNMSRKGEEHKIGTRSLLSNVSTDYVLLNYFEAIVNAFINEFVCKAKI